MKIGLMEIKQALNDGRFRDALPVELRDDLVKYLQCPSCPSHVEFYRKILKQAKQQLKEYYPESELYDIEAEDKKIAENNWTVINCHVSEIESRLKALGPGRMQIAIARFEDQATVIVNILPYF